MTTAFFVWAQQEGARAIGSDRPAFSMTQGSRLMENGLNDTRLAMTDRLEPG